MPKQKNELTQYTKKRDFTKTKEPKPKKKKVSSKNIFVVQKHNASHLHYDFRLEINGVLKSWAIPKGPSLDPKIKRLAIETEDHPLDYATFEGTIPEGQYGGGTVMVWDLGTFENLKDEPLIDCYKHGQLELALKGKKLKGNFVLVKTHLGPNSWLFKKMSDKYAKDIDIVKSKDKSVLTKRSTQQISQKVKPKKKK